MDINRTKILTLLFVGLLFCSCSSQDKKVVVYVNSYHKGHPSSDEIMSGFTSNMSTDSFMIHSYYMDTKRNPSKKYIQDKARQLFDSIDHIKPDLLVVSDDNAVKYIVEPNIHKLQIPVIFCGVNWSAKDYVLPRSKITGILEILPVSHALKTLKTHYPSSKKLLVLNENTTTSRKEEQILDTLFHAHDLTATYKLVDNFEQWKTAFEQGNREFDLIYISTHAAIHAWNNTEAKEFISENIRVPVFTCEDFMMPYAVLGVTKIAEEHGIWAAETAKQILSGIEPETIPVARNKESTKWLNKDLAEKIGFNFNEEMLKDRFVLWE